LLNGGVTRTRREDKRAEEADTLEALRALMAAT